MERLGVGSPSAHVAAVAIDRLPGPICRSSKSRTRSEIGAALALCKETVVTDAVEAIGQDVQEEAADELIAARRMRRVRPPRR